MRVVCECVCVGGGGGEGEVKLAINSSHCCRRPGVLGYIITFLR